MDSFLDANRQTCFIVRVSSRPARLLNACHTYFLKKSTQPKFERTKSSRGHGICRSVMFYLLAPNKYLGFTKSLEYRFKKYIMAS